jgi:multidrug efflux system outer membrane protein
LLVLLLFGAGCAVGPAYKRPVLSVPSGYRTAEDNKQESSLADLPWWEVFKDSTLHGLVQKALANNYDLQAAVSRVEQARQIAAQARSQYFPFINYSMVGSYGKNEFAGSVVPNDSKSQGTFLAFASVAWEADVWGRLRRLNEAARAQYLSTEEARRGVMLSLVSDTAQAYFELLDLELQLDIAKRTTDSFAQTLDLFTKRLEGGIASKLDTSRADAARAVAAASIPEIERQIALKENEISVLIGSSPEQISRDAQLLDQIVPPDIPVGLPSALLERRPDVLEAEQQMRFANAQVGVTTAAFFPRLGLTALFGHASTSLAEMSSGQGIVASVAADLSGPIYQGGSLRAQKRQAVASWEETKSRYAETALRAFQDVSDALISRQKYESIRAAQLEAVAAYRESVTVSLQRYVAGRASYYEVLEAQQQLFPAENSLAVTELNRRVVIVQLYKALGGGWNLQDPAWVGPQTSSP